MTTPNMNLERPTVGGSEGTWGTELNDLLETVDAHDHTSGKGVKIPTAGINIDDDVEFSGNHATGVGAVEFTALADFGSIIRSLAVKGDNDLYYINALGQEVKITSGDALDISSVGGFGGDYSVDPNAEARYTTATELFSFYANTGDGDYATVRGKAFEARESNSTNGVTVAPASGTESYTLTLPGETPSATESMSMTATGELAADGAHGERKLQIPGGLGFLVTGSGNSQGNRFTIGSGGALVRYPVQMRAGDIITNVRVWIREATGTGTVTEIEFYRETMSGGVNDTQIGDTMFTTGSPSGLDSHDITGISDEEVLEDNQYYLQTRDGSLGVYTYMIEITYRRD